MDRFDALQAFARVVEAGSFTKAAQTLHLSKTTVTQLVQQLKARLRIKLLHRTTRRVSVTPRGAAYYDRVVHVLADLEDADAGVASLGRAPRAAARDAQPIRSHDPGCRRCLSSTHAIRRFRSTWGSATASLM